MLEQASAERVGNILDEMSAEPIAPYMTYEGQAKSEIPHLHQKTRSSKKES